MDERAPSFTAKQEKAKTQESPELFRASLGFDFLFYEDAQGKKQCVCVEINGDYSGLGGVAGIPKGDIDKTKRIVADIRDTRNPKRREATEKAMAISADLKSGEFSATLEAKEKIEKFLTKSVLKHPFFPHAFRNPPFIQSITMDKSRQEYFIPKEHIPRTYHKGGPTKSSTGYWICKPNGGRGGENIIILSTLDFRKRFVGHKYEEYYTAQELVPSVGADKAPEGLRGHPASMRLLIDFIYHKDGTIEPVFESAYQRVSPLLDTKGEREGGGLIRHEDVHVVNKFRGAKSAAVSDAEIQIAYPVAEQIIHNIAKDYKEQTV